MPASTPTTVTFRFHQRPHCPLCMHPISVNALLVVSGVIFCHTCAEGDPQACLDVCMLMESPFMSQFIISSHGLRAWTDRDYDHLNARGVYHRHMAAEHRAVDTM